MKRIVKKALLALAAVTLAGIIVAPKDVIAMPKTDGPICTFCGAASNCLCSVLESKYHCGSTKYEHGVIYTLGCKGDGVTCSPIWMKAPTPSNAVELKPNTQHTTEQKVVAASDTTHNDFSEHHPVDLNTISHLYAINPDLDMNAALAIANMSIEEYNAQVAAYYNAYAEQLALYEAMINENNAQITAFLNAYAEQLALYGTVVNANPQ